MEDLYLETKNGRKRIDEKSVEKYHLEAGTMSPFTHNRIVEQNGEFRLKATNNEDSEDSIHQDFNAMPVTGIVGDGVDQMENGFEFSQSEIIDFSQGVDSRMDENK